MVEGCKPKRKDVNTSYSIKNVNYIRIYAFNQLKYTTIIGNEINILSLMSNKRVSY